MTNADIKRKRLLRDLEDQPLLSSETGTKGYEGTRQQRAIDYWMEKSMGSKKPPLEVIPKWVVEQLRRLAIERRTKRI